MKKKIIYVISDKLRLSAKEHKFGKHNGEKNVLIRRYVTAIPNVEILYFREVSNNNEIEDIIKEKLDDNRIINVNGIKSEWVCMETKQLISTINKLINAYERKHPIDNTFPKTINKKIKMYKDDDRNKIIKYGDVKITVIIDDNNNIWFRAIEVAKAIGYKKCRNATDSHTLKIHDTLPLRDISCKNKKGYPQTLYVNEMGLIRITTRSILPNARDISQKIICIAIPYIKENWCK